MDGGPADGPASDLRDHISVLDPGWKCDVVLIPLRPAPPLFLHVPLTQTSPPLDLCRSDLHVLICSGRVVPTDKHAVSHTQ